MTLPAQTALFCTETDVQDLLSVMGERARLDDDNTGTVADGTPGWVKAANYATTRVKAYCQPRYGENLGASWLVNEWATIIAAHWLCTRRGNPVPDSLREMLYGDGTPTNIGVMGELQEVRAGRFKIPDIGTRNVEWPAWSNVRVDPIYRLRQIRVQRPISERTATQYRQNVDRVADVTFEI